MNSSRISLRKNLEFQIPRSFLYRRKGTVARIHQEVARLRAAADVALNIGSGEHPVEGMINCDLHNPKAERLGNCTTFPDFVEGSVDHIESHHMIEHLAISDAMTAIREWFRILRSRGFLIITCPDLDEVCRLWRKESTDASPESYVLKMLYGSQEHEGMYHKSGYNKAILSDILTSAGFSVEFTFTPYPIRPTPSLLVVARKP